MKTILIYCIILVSIPVKIIADTTIGLYMGSGITIPNTESGTGHLGNNVTGGIYIGLGSYFEIAPRIGINTIGDEGFFIFDASVTIAEFSVGFKTYLNHPESTLSPYLLAGGGSANWDSWSSITRPLAYGGFGIRIRLNKELSILFEPRYCNVFLQKTNKGYVPITAGIQIGL